MKINENEIYSFSLSQLEEMLLEIGQPKYRAKQIYEWLHTRNIKSYEEMSNVPKLLREYLTSNFPITSSEIFTEKVSQDSSRKYVLKLPDDSLVETVGILSSDKTRLTVCFSTQIGCSMGCAFCATGQEGFARNISSQEMIDQIITVRDSFGIRVNNLVAMGQGEPFLNYDNLLNALRRANNDQGLFIGARHITVSTCGIIDGINRFSTEPEQFNLAVSLHSAIQSKRNQLMPRLSQQPLDALYESLLNYQQKKGRRITFEYVMIDGINSSESDLEALIDYCTGIFCHINIIPFNAIEGSIYSSPNKQAIYNWEKTLNSSGISTTIRNSKGSDISGACGQLKNSF